MKRSSGGYTNGYSRPNKPVNELVSLEIIKHLLDISDEELEYAYIFDFRVRNALGTGRHRILVTVFGNLDSNRLPSGGLTSDVNEF